MKKYINTLQNMKSLSAPIFLKELKGILRDTPAIVCGAGESLLKDQKTLSLAQKKAVIFAGGSTLSLCSKLNIFPHLALAIDPDPLYERFKETNSFCPLFITLFRNASFFSRFFQDENIVAFEEENSLEKDIIEEFGKDHQGYDYGWNVGNFQAFVAAYLGCNPIVFTGMDMGFQSQEYALPLEKEDKEHTQVDNVAGETSFFSRKDLLLGKEYFEKLTKMFPQTTFIQTKHSPVCPSGFEHKEISSVIEKWISQDVSGHLHHILLRNKKNESLTKFVNNYELMLQNDLSKAIKIFEKIKKICQSLQDKGITSTSFKEEYLALEEYELENLKTYKVLLQPVWVIWKHLLFQEKKKLDAFEKTSLKFAFFQRVVEEFSLQLNKVSISESKDEKRSV